MSLVRRFLMAAAVVTLLATPGLWPAQRPPAVDLSASEAHGAPLPQQFPPTPSPTPQPTQRPATCTSPSASANPSSVLQGAPVTIIAQGFQPGNPVTITISGPAPNATQTVSPDSQCRVNTTVQTTGDPPGTYTVTLQGASGPQYGDGNLTLTTQYVILAPSPTAPAAAATPTQTQVATSCQFPSATMVSERISPGQTASLIGRGFSPGSLVQITIDGPAGRFASVVSRPASNTCEVSQQFSTTANEAPGRYTVVLTGTNPSGAAVTAQTEFEIVGGAAPMPTATVPAGVTPPPTFTPTVVPPGPTEPGIAPLVIDQSLTVTGGSLVPVVGEMTEYQHVMRITNTGAMGRSAGSETASVDLGAIVQRTELGTVRLRILAQGETLVLRSTTEYSPGTTVVSSTSNVGQPSVQGSTLVLEGRISPGQTMTLTTTVQQTPTTAGALNEPIRSQSVTATNAQGRPVTVRPPARPVPPPAQRLVQPPPPPVDPATGSRFFPETGFSVADDSIWLYFNRRGGQRTFGTPISRLMLLNGAWVQLFEKGMLQVFEDGRVVSVNLLEAPHLPYETLGDLVLPPVDEQLIAAAPDPTAADFATRSQEFVRENAPEQFENLVTRFYSSFLSTVLFRDAFFDGRGDPNLVPGFNLEIWGLPTSRPAWQVIGPEQVDPAVALLRFQRGVMIHDARAGTTSAAPLGYYLRSILMGDLSQPALAEAAATSPLWAQYDPSALDWVARPNELGLTNLVLVFTREDAVDQPASPPSSTVFQLWLLVLAPTTAYNDAGEELWMAAPGERYRVLQQDSGWAQVVREGDSPEAAVWIQLDGRVEAEIQ